MGVQAAEIAVVDRLYSVPASDHDTSHPALTEVSADKGADDEEAGVRGAAARAIAVGAAAEDNAAVVGNDVAAAAAAAVA